VWVAQWLSAKVTHGASCSWLLSKRSSEQRMTPTRGTQRQATPGSGMLLNRRRNQCSPSPPSFLVSLLVGGHAC